MACPLGHPNNIQITVKFDLYRSAAVCTCRINGIGQVPVSQSPLHEGSRKGVNSSGCEEPLTRAVSNLVPGGGRPSLFPCGRFDRGRF